MFPAALQVWSSVAQGVQTMARWHSARSLCERALKAAVQKEWWTSFTFGLTPRLAEWRGRQKCVKWAGGRRAGQRRLTVLISVTYCRHCLPFLFLSQTVFWQIDAPIIVLLRGYKCLRCGMSPKCGLMLFICTPQTCNQLFFPVLSRFRNNVRLLKNFK